MYDKAHVGLVDAHAERICGDYYARTAAYELLLSMVTLVTAHTAVIPSGIYTHTAQSFTHLIHCRSGQAVYYAALSAALAQKFAQFSQFILGLTHVKV